MPAWPKAGRKTKVQHDDPGNPGSGPWFGYDQTDDVGGQMVEDDGRKEDEVKVKNVLKGKFPDYDAVKEKGQGQSEHIVFSGGQTQRYPHILENGFIGVMRW